MQIEKCKVTELACGGLFCHFAIFIFQRPLAILLSLATHLHLRWRVTFFL